MGTAWFASAWFWTDPYSVVLAAVVRFKPVRKGTPSPLSPLCRGGTAVSFSDRPRETESKGVRGTRNRENTGQVSPGSRVPGVGGQPVGKERGKADGRMPTWRATPAGKGGEPRGMAPAFLTDPLWTKSQVRTHPKAEGPDRAPKGAATVARSHRARPSQRGAIQGAVLSTGRAPAGDAFRTRGPEGFAQQI